MIDFTSKARQALMDGGMSSDVLALASDAQITSIVRHEVLHSFMLIERGKGGINMGTVLVENLGIYYEFNQISLEAYRAVLPRHQKRVLVEMLIDDEELEHAHEAYAEWHGETAKTDVAAIANDIQRYCYDDGAMHGGFKVLSVEDIIRGA
jgi:hypothetical protein